MTNEEAIQTIKSISQWEYWQNDTLEAFILAIKALEERPQGEIVIKCNDCKHQKKYWHEDRRMKDKGYWVYGCNLIDDSFVGTPVWGLPNQYCSSAEQKGGAEND